MVVERMTFPITGSITVQLPVALFDRWLAYPAHWGEGIEVLTATREIRITGAVSATIGAVPMQPYESGRLGLRFEGPAGQEFELDIGERKGWLVRLVPGKYLIVPLEAGLESIPMADRYVIAREVPKSEIPLLLAPCTFAARTFMGYNWYRAKAGEGKAVSPVVLRQAGFIFWFHSYIEANHERILERWYEHRGDTE